jgi:transposase
MLYRWQFFFCKKRGPGVGKTKRGKGTKLMAIADRNGLPIAISTHEASTHEVKLVETAISKRFIRTKPKRIIGDMAYDSDPLDKRMKSKQIKMIAPHKANRVKESTQDGRELRRYRNRWKVERLFAWIQQFRRCQTRYDYHEQNFLGFVQLACIVILLRNYF